MITNFADFCLWMYVIIDELWQEVAPLYRRPGPAPRCSDSELLTLLLVGECQGWDRETDLLSLWREHADLFPVLPERSRLNRRRRNLLDALNDLRRIVLTVLDLAGDPQTIIDSMPVPVMSFRRVGFSPATGDWKADGAAYGRVSRKQHAFFGYKLHLLITFGGVIRDFVLAPANERDLPIGEALLTEHHDLVTLADKAYISAPVAQRLQTKVNVTLLTVPRVNQVQRLSPGLIALQHRYRQLIETVNAQLTLQFHLKANHAHHCWGLCARLLAKLTAHTLCIYLNRLLGNPDWLQIKALAFH